MQSIQKKITENTIPCQIQFTTIFYARNIFKVNFYSCRILRMKALTESNKNFFSKFTINQTINHTTNPRTMDRSLLVFFRSQMVVSTSYMSSEQLGKQSQSIPNKVSFTSITSTVGTLRLAKISVFVS